MKCNLIVPGFAKCGTSSLHQYLQLHPDICMSKNKEPHFFSHRDIYKRGSEWHDSLFEINQHAEPLIYGESSTSYCYDEQALKRIKSDLMTPKLILLIRAPIERLLSHYQWMWALGLEDRPLLKAIREEEENEYDIHYSFKDSGNYATYIRGSRYSIYIPMIQNLFGKENILCLRSSDLRHNPQLVLKNCFHFLQIKDFSVNQSYSSNQTKDIKYQRKFGLKQINKLLSKEIKDYIDPEHQVRRWIISKLGKKHRRKPNISIDETNIISEILEEDIKFYNLLFQQPSHA